MPIRFAAPRDAYDSLPRSLRRGIADLGAEKTARSEIAAAVDEMADELEPSYGRESAKSIALAFMPNPIATAVILRAQIQKLGRIRSAMYEAIEEPLPNDAVPESHAFMRIVRRRIKSLTRFPGTD